ncbi:hypothetical protein MIT9_P1207 [Methylomarinovum caldicuralii]|uniref:Lipoprotein n=1 Tax=Methylomarinovum caldicuralii TaxID=438856 RepID=A0AAU9C6P0_9GAMM|nr:hypothetical protein [Methylomarinovum caldicuralii]BCX81629.1 hypothetical protein MIT9_P1207 [Methylomarinovum caldicuralii]
MRIAILAFLLLTLAACSKVTPENYDKLELGMTWQEVVQLLGEPDRCEAVLNAKSCTWQEGERKITVRFIGDQVVLFSSEGL